MKMADGGFHPAVNVRYAAAVDSQVILAVCVLTTGSDMGQIPPALDQIEERFGQRPKDVRRQAACRLAESFDEVMRRHLLARNGVSPW